MKEAIACECLCVVSYTIGIEELVLDGVTGYVIQQSDVDQAFERIHRAFSNPIEMQHMTQQAYRHLKANFDIDQIAQFLQASWKSLAQK